MAMGFIYFSRLKAYLARVITVILDRKEEICIKLNLIASFNIKMMQFFIDDAIK